MSVADDQQVCPARVGYLIHHLEAAGLDSQEASRAHPFTQHERTPQRMHTMQQEHQPSEEVIQQNELMIQRDEKAFELVQRQAKMLSASTLVPKDFQNNMANCAIAINISRRTQLDELMVCQNLAIIHGKPSWSATALIGMINSSGRYTPLRFTFDDDDAPTWCYASAKDKESGEELKGEKITLEMAKAEGWSTKSGSKWKTMPGQMLRYRAASFWSRAYASDISLGLMTQDEVVDSGIRNVTPKKPKEVIDPFENASELIEGTKEALEDLTISLETPAEEKEAELELDAMATGADLMKDYVEGDA